MTDLRGGAHSTRVWSGVAERDSVASNRFRFAFFLAVGATLIGVGVTGCARDESPQGEASRLTIHYAHPVDEVDCRAPTCRIVRTQSVLGTDEPIALIEEPIYTAPLASLVELSVERRPSVHGRERGSVWVPLVFVDEVSQRAIWPAFNDTQARPGRVIAAVAIDGRAIVSVTRGTLPSPIELGEYGSLEAARAIVAPLGLPVAEPGAGLGGEARRAADPGRGAAEPAPAIPSAGAFDVPGDDTLRTLETFEARLEVGAPEDPEVVAQALSEFLRDRGDR